MVRYVRTPGALFASIGTSVMLVAAVTISLLSVSAVFALGGFEGSRDASSADELVLDLQSRSGSGSESRLGSRSVGSAERAAVAVVKRRPARRGGTASRSASRFASRRYKVRASVVSTASVAAATSPAAALDEGTAGQAPGRQRPAAPTVDDQLAPNLGDGVRQVGDGLSSAVRQNGTKLAEATAALPPVSVAVQHVLNVLAEVLKGTTDGLGGVLGARP